MASSSSQPDTRRTIGRFMAIIFWLLVLIALTSAFQRFLAYKNNPNQRVASSIGVDGRPEVVLKRNQQGHYVANGFINDVSVTFLLDTGATGVALPLAVARAAGVPRGPTVTTKTANGPAQGFLTELETVRLGAIEQRAVGAVVSPGLAMDEVLLGMTFLKNLEITQRGNTLTLRQ